MLSGVIEKFYVLIANVFTCLYVFVKTQTVQVKQVYCIAYKLYSIKKKKSRPFAKCSYHKISKYEDGRKLLLVKDIFIAQVVVIVS